MVIMFPGWYLLVALGFFLGMIIGVLLKSKSKR